MKERQRADGDGEGKGPGAREGGLSGLFGLSRWPDRQTHQANQRNQIDHSDTHLNGPLAAQHAGEHGYALFREYIGRVWRPPLPLGFDIPIWNVKAAVSCADNRNMPPIGTAI
jgi:hypothetical protein